MFKAFVLIRNFESASGLLDFGEFTIGSVGTRFRELREIFSSIDVNQDDWILEKSYSQLPFGPPGSPVGGIPAEIEDILLLLRLYRIGDISFIRQAIVPPSGNTFVQFPYRAMNDLNSYSPLRFRIADDECTPWRRFADGIRSSKAWGSDWFAVARRFFLCGGAKPMNPRWDDVDRILDYATALEATLVPERDYNTRRLSNRAGTLIAGANGADRDDVVRLVKKLYDIRSRVVHGSSIGGDNREWLIENCARIELSIRQVLVSAVQNLPAADEDRGAVLARLYDPTDSDRSGVAIDKFKEIKDPAIRKSTAEKIANLARK